MENIRIGNSVHVSWRLYNNNGSQYVLSGKIRRLWIISAALEKEISSYGIQGRNELVFSIPADDLIRYGTYKIRLTIRESESGTEDATYELTQVFQVVSKSYPNASGAVSGVVELPFTTVLNNVVVERIEGLSAYEIAVNNGYEGTEQEWVAEYNNALNAATTAAADASAAITAFNANEQARIEVENERVAAEAARVLAENARVSAESSRESAEATRASNESARVTAENSRVDAESSRVSAESSRVSAESSRVSAESARATRSASDHTRAENDHSLAVSDHSTASSDHTTAAGDHTTAVSDHTRAENDHTTAAADHTTAGGDHTTATGDHTQAVADHTQAASDHTASVSATAVAIAAAAAATEAAEGIEQSDWSENDSDDPAYIKNRTHWDESVVADTIKVTGTGVVDSSNNVDLLFSLDGTGLSWPSPFPLGGAALSIGGVDYLLDLSMGYISLTQGSGFPVELAEYEEEYSYGTRTISVPSTITIPDGIDASNVHKLNNKYLDLDSTPTLNSQKPVTSDGVKRALNAIPSQKQSDWSVSDSSDPAFIKNKPTIPTVPVISTNVETDGTSDTKTSSPKSVKTFVEGKGYYTKPQSGIPASDIAAGVIPTVPTDTVKYSTQSLTDAQKEQARTNIGAADESEVSQLRSEVLDGIYYDQDNTGKTSLVRWTDNAGVIGTASSTFLSGANVIQVKPGQIVEIFCDGSPTVSADGWGYVCDDSGNILLTISENPKYAVYTKITIPAGGAKLYVNFRNNFFVKIGGKLAQIDGNLARKIVDGKFLVAFSEDDFVNYGINGNTGDVTTNPKVLLSNYTEIVPGSTIYYSTSNSYRLGIYYYKDKNYLTKDEWYTGAGSRVAPANTVYVRIGIASPAGASYSPVWDDISLSVSLSKTYQIVPAASQEDVDKSLSAYFDYELPILSPSPQLPADGETGSDFDAETMTSTEIQAAIESQIDKLTVPNVGANPYAPKYGTIYETIGKDASGQYDIKAYVFTRRNRFAWRASAALYVWKSGGTTYYTDHRSPLVGDTVYSDNARTDSGYTVTAYNSAGPSITVNGNTYTRDDSAKVEATDIFTQTQLTTGTTSIQAYNKAGVSLGNATVSSPTQIVLSGKTYTRLPSGDFHTENKATIVIWGNEHGPQSDPTEPSIIIYRLIKDLCECGGGEFLKFLRKYCKLVFIPAANPYGINKFVSGGGEGRNNFNNVNINRNYDTVGWGTQTDSDKGSYAGDQPETQFIMNTALDVGADIAIDIHCLGYASSVLNEGRTHYEGYVSEINGKVEDIMRGFCGHSYTSYGSESPTTRSTGADWIYSLGIAGGLIEMNAGPYAAAFDGKQHNAGIMFTDYTLLLNVIRMWYYQFDPTLDLSRLSIR